MSVLPGKRRRLVHRRSSRSRLARTIERREGAHRAFRTLGSPPPHHHYHPFPPFCLYIHLVNSSTSRRSCETCVAISGFLILHLALSSFHVPGTRVWPLFSLFFLLSFRPTLALCILFVPRGCRLLFFYILHPPVSSVCPSTQINPRVCHNTLIQYGLFSAHLPLPSLLLPLSCVIVASCVCLLSGVGTYISYLSRSTTLQNCSMCVYGCPVRYKISLKSPKSWCVYYL